MWIRCGGWILFVFLFFLVCAAGSAMSICGMDPPVPTGGIAWPLAGDVTNPWSLDCASDRGHRGIDIAADTGSRVGATAAGTVSFVGYTPAEGGGTTITIDHEGGLRSTYLHLAVVTVAKGESISLGELIGFTDGSPLHFGLKLATGSTYFNPLDILPAMGSNLPDVIKSPVEELPAEAAPVKEMPAPATPSPLPAPLSVQTVSGTVAHPAAAPVRANGIYPVAAPAATSAPSLQNAPAARESSLLQQESLLLPGRVLMQVQSESSDKPLSRINGGYRHQVVLALIILIISAVAARSSLQTGLKSLVSNTSSC
jgi:hypothetical protein